MQKLILILVLVLSIGAGIFIGKNYLAFKSDNQTLPIEQENLAQVSKSLEAEVSEPKTLEIPKIGVAADIEYVGLDQEGRMDVPKIAANVAWYNLGPKPGEVGSAVFSGHLDDVGGRPAVFWNLKRLIAGDEIIITDNQGKAVKFIVKEKQSYQFDQFPLERVFNTNDKPRLNLITCDGSWDPVGKNYSKREVVFAEIAQGSI